MNQTITQPSQMEMNDITDIQSSIKKIFTGGSIESILQSLLQKKRIQEEIKNFRQVYCPNKNNSLYKEHKNIKFAQFYFELGASFNIDKKILEKQIKLILFLVEQIHKWDDLIDERNVPVAFAKKLVIPNLEQKELSLNLNSTGLSIREMKALENELLETKKKELHLIKQLNISLKGYIKIKNKHMNIIEGYFNKEKRFTKIKATKSLVRNMLILGNCDFYFYNTLFYFLIPVEEIRKLDTFLQSYLIIDLFLDHIVDLEDDLKHGAFNTLSWFYESNYSDKLLLTNFDEQLRDSGTYTVFLTIMKDFEQVAEMALDAITNKKLYALLKYYLDGELKGLILFRKYNYFMGFSQKKRQELKNAVLKTHPWCLAEANNR